MVCGSKRYFARVEYKGQIQNETVAARTPAEARKALRKKYGREAKIIAVRQQNGPNQIRQ